MFKKQVFFFSLILLITISCEKKSDEKTDGLVQFLEEKMNPLSEDPLLWSDDDLRFLDRIANKSIIGLGEATHGTSEFFKAKHRIFRYLVEKHGYKIFAFEADFGESLLINEAIQKSDSNSIEILMKTKMHFWTWKTEEVKDLLVWMCRYNASKSEEEKVHYMGIDCQFNTFNPDMVKEYLYKTDAPFYSFAEAILNEAKVATGDSFNSYSQDKFENFIKQVTDLQDSLVAYKSKLILAGSEKDYLLHERILEVVRQVSIQRYYYYQKKDYTVSHRDKFMAENAAWMLEYFNGKKVVVWAHNGHISNNSVGTLGNYLDMKLIDNYVPVGFLFSKGTFTGIGRQGDQYTNLSTQTLDSDPEENSLNYIMSLCKESVFSIRMWDLISQEEWHDELYFNNLQYFQIGAVFNYTAQDYYAKFSPGFFDYIIYFDKSNASEVLQ